MTPARPAEAAVAAAILDLVTAAGPAASIDPSDAAKALSPEWRPLLGPVRQAALKLAREGRIDILRKGKPVDPGEMRGVIRLRLRAEPPGDATA